MCISLVSFNNYMRVHGMEHIKLIEQDVRVALESV
jgi:hypothetical protein